MCKTIHTFLKGRCLWGLALVFGVLSLSSGFASADVSPAGCTANNVNTNLTRTPSILVSGTTVHYTGMITNGGANACDATITTDVVIHCPAADGSPTGTVVLVIDIPP